MRKKRVLDVEKERFWRKLFARFVKSKLPFRQFCKIEKISPNTFQYWRKELRKRDEERGVTSKITKGENNSSKFTENVKHWRQVLAALDEFEGSDREFCRKYLISSGSLHYWRSKLNLLEDTDAPGADATPKVMIPVKVLRSRPAFDAAVQPDLLQDQRIEIRLEHGRLLFLPSTTPVDLLIQLLNGLGGADA